METRNIRIQKLRALIDQAGGIAAFARQNNGVDPTYVSQLLNGHRSFGEKAARNMEKKTGLPNGYFDLADSVQIENKNVLIHQQEPGGTVINWPFSITYEQYMEIEKPKRDALNDAVNRVMQSYYDEHSKEREILQQKKRAALKN